MDTLKERRELQLLLKGMPRSPKQVHGLFEADAEILKLNAREFWIASTDSIGEEITIGLYAQPETWGWMTAASSISDLAATGGEALGLLVSSQWAFATGKETQTRFHRGLGAALKKSKIPLLGGDSGAAGDHVFTSTILGRAKTMPLTRLGVRPGDSVFLCGRRLTGAGPALAYRFLKNLPAAEFAEDFFRPLPPHARMKAMRPRMSAAIDTSDGVAVALAIVAKLNGVGFDLDWRPETLHPEAVSFCRRHGIPEELLWTGDHGDFQPLVFARGREALRLGSQKDFVYVGRAVAPKTGVRLRKEGSWRGIPVDALTSGTRDRAFYEALLAEMTAHFRRP